MKKKRQKVVAVIQARMGSTRLPHKVVMPIAGRTPIEWAAYRLSFAKEIDEIVVSTVKGKKNNPVVATAEKIGLRSFRGSELDLVGRLLGTAEKFEADSIVRITADCPLVDPEVVDKLVREYRQRSEGVDLVTNVFPPTYPDGLDVEVVPRHTLERLDKEVKDSLWREWITANIMDNPDRFRIINVSNKKDLSGIRLTLDYPEDQELISSVFTKLHKDGTVFGLREIVRLFDREPELLRINRGRVDALVVNRIRSRALYETKKDSKGQ